jgi:hypothetical protein
MPAAAHTLELSFRLRQALSWSPAPAPPLPLRLSSLCARLGGGGARRFDVLEHRLDLTPLTRAKDVATGLEALWCVDVLDRLVGRERLPSQPALDVGAKNATHLPGQFSFAPCPWDLVEVDAHRRYVDFTTRGAHGKAMAARFRGARYLSQDVRELSGRYGLITWFLPFVVARPHAAWGLPPRLFAPEETLAHVVSLLAEGGALVIVNQGEAEAEVQRRLLDDVKDEDGGVNVDEWGALPTLLSPYQHERFGFVVRRRRCS